MFGFMREAFASGAAMGSAAAVGARTVLRGSARRGYLGSWAAGYTPRMTRDIALGAATGALWGGISDDTSVLGGMGLGVFGGAFGTGAKIGSRLAIQRAALSSAARSRLTMGGFAKTWGRQMYQTGKASAGQFGSYFRSARAILPVAGPFGVM